MLTTESVINILIVAAIAWLLAGLVIAAWRRIVRRRELDARIYQAAHREAHQQ